MIIENFIIFMNKILLFSSFINNAQGFPQPLKEAEEKEYFEKFKNGDKEAKDKLINHNLRLVAHIVKKYAGTSEADDLISVGTIVITIFALSKPNFAAIPINSFEYGKGTQLSTYAARCIENEILMLLRVSKKHKNVISLDESLGEDKDGNDIEISDIIPSDEEDILTTVENNVITSKINKIIDSKLDSRESEIIKLRYGIGSKTALTQREVASKLGISRSYISRLETKAIETIKKEVSKDSFFIE